MLSVLSVVKALTTEDTEITEMKKVLLVLFLAASPAFAKEVVPFIDNDYAKALAQAKKANLPIFVDAWAPW